MLGLLESKLNSLPPEIINNYPELTHISLNDNKGDIVKITNISNNLANTNAHGNNMNDSIANQRENNKKNSLNDNDDNARTNIDEPIQEEPEKESEPTPQEKLTKFLEENEDIKVYYNMLK